MVEKDEKLSLAAKLARIGKEIGTIKKTGKNMQQNYAYIEYGTVAGRIRELFDEHRIIIIPKVEDYSVDDITNSKGGKGFHYVLKMSFTIVNGDDKDDKIESTWLGEGADYGDKGINKAETSGTKYFLMRLFNVSEKGEEEADAASPEIANTTVQRAYTVDFKQVREKLKTIDSVEGLNRYWAELKLSEKQASFVKGDFAKRKAEIGGENGLE